MSKSIDAVEFTRSAVARILLCTTLTMSNRESNGTYPAAQRAANNYRIYTLSDIFELMMITHGRIYFKPLVVEFWNKGFEDPEEVFKILVSTKEEFLKTHPQYSEEVAT